MKTPFLLPSTRLMPSCEVGEVPHVLADDGVEPVEDPVVHREELDLVLLAPRLRGSGAQVRDVRADELRALAGGWLGDAVPAVLAALGPDLADDAELVGTVRRRSEDLSGRR